MSDVTNGLSSSTSSDMKQITELLREIITVQGRHTSLLQQMLDAATRPIDVKSPVAVALEALVASTNGQTTAIGALMGTMQNLPAQISAGMKLEVDRAMNEF